MPAGLRRRRYRPDAEELWPFARRGGLTLPGETAHVVDGQHRRRDEPRRAQQRTDGDLNGDHQQIEVVPGSFLSTAQHTHTVTTNVFHASFLPLYIDKPNYNQKQMDYIPFYL